MPEPLTEDELIAAALACERAALLPHGGYMTKIAQKLRDLAEQMRLKTHAV